MNKICLIGHGISFVLVLVLFDTDIDVPHTHTLWRPWEAWVGVLAQLEKPTRQPDEPILLAAACTKLELGKGLSWRQKIKSHQPTGGLEATDLDESREGVCVAGEERMSKGHSTVRGPDTSKGE